VERGPSRAVFGLSSGRLGLPLERPCTSLAQRFRCDFLRKRNLENRAPASTGARFSQFGARLQASSSHVFRVFKRLRRVLSRLKASHRVSERLGAPRSVTARSLPGPGWVYPPGKGESTTETPPDAARSGNRLDDLTT